MVQQRARDSLAERRAMAVGSMGAAARGVRFAMCAWRTE